MEDKSGWKIYLFLKFEILALFGNTLTADHAHSPHSCETFRNRFKRYFLNNQKYFLQILLDFSILQKILHILIKNINFIA